MDDAQARQRLVEERARLAEVRSGLSEGNGLDESEGESLAELSSIDQHQADLGTETFEREKDLAILESIESELADVEHALRRLDDGTYGVCEACGRPIDEERLEALPATRLCRDDQQRAEQDAGVTGGRAGE